MNKTKINGYTPHKSLSSFSNLAAPASSLNSIFLYRWAHSASWTLILSAGVLFDLVIMFAYPLLSTIIFTIQNIEIKLTEAIIIAKLRSIKSFLRLAFALALSIFC